MNRYINNLNELSVEQLQSLRKTAIHDIDFACASGNEGRFTQKQVNYMAYLIRKKGGTPIPFNQIIK